MIERARAREIENEEKQEAKMSLTCERRKKETHGRKTWMGGAEKGKGACNTTTKGAIRARELLHYFCWCEK